MQFEKTSVILHCQLMDLNLQLSVHPYFSSKPPRTFWLYPSDSGSETSACPLDPDEKTHKHMNIKNCQKYLIPGILHCWLVPAEKASASQNPPPEALSAARAPFADLDKDFGTCWSKFPAVMISHSPDASNFTSHGAGVLLVQRCHGDVVHVSELLSGCLVADCQLLHLTHAHTHAQTWSERSETFGSSVKQQRLATRLSPAPAAAPAAPPSRRGAPPSGARPRPGDTCGWSPPRPPARPPVAAAAPAAPARRPPPAPLSPGGVAPTAPHCTLRKGTKCIMENFDVLLQDLALATNFSPISSLMFLISADSFS